MDNRNLYTQMPQAGGYYPYYPAATGPYMRPEPSTYAMPQPAPAAIIKGRPVSSAEEARVAQIDLDGSVFIFPDLGNKKIYTKRINIDGTATLQTFSLDETGTPTQVEYATKDEIKELKATVESLLAKLSESTPKTNFTF